MVFALKIWRFYLYGVHVDVYTDHKSLHYVFTQKELNLRKKRCLEFFKWHECSLSPRKANVVVDALSSMTMGIVSHTEKARKDLVRDVHRSARLGVRLEDSPNRGFIVHHNSESSLVIEVKSNQHFDKPLMELKESVSW